MSAKKYFCSFGFAAKFSAVRFVLQSVAKHSALEGVDWSRFNITVRFVLEDFAWESACVTHLNFFFRLYGTFLNSGSRLLFSSENVRILIGGASYLASKRPLGKDLLVVGHFWLWQSWLLVTEVALEGVRVSVIFCFVARLCRVVSDSVRVILTLL